MPDVSVLIPSLNSARTLDRCLASVAEQTSAPIETLVIDGGSTDGSQSLAVARGAKVLEGTYGMSAARNAGLQASTGSYILNLDSDMWLEPNCIDACLRLARHGVGGVILPERAIGVGFWARSVALGRNLTLPLQRRAAAGVPRFYSRGELIEAGGWNNSLTWGEDVDLFLRIRRTVSIGVADTTVFHSEFIPNLSFLYERWKSAEKWGSLREFARLHPTAETSAIVENQLTPLLEPEALSMILRQPHLFFGLQLVRLTKLSARAASAVHT